MMPSERDKPKRRWLQFSLKTLLIVMVFASGYFAGIGTVIRREQRMKQQAIENFEAARVAAQAARVAEFRAYWAMEVRQRRWEIDAGMKADALERQR